MAWVNPLAAGMKRAAEMQGQGAFQPGSDFQTQMGNMGAYYGIKPEDVPYSKAANSWWWNNALAPDPSGGGAPNMPKGTKPMGYGSAPGYSKPTGDYSMMAANKDAAIKAGLIPNIPGLGGLFGGQYSVQELQNMGYAPGAYKGTAGETFRGYPTAGPTGGAGGGGATGGGATGGQTPMNQPLPQGGGATFGTPPGGQDPRLAAAMQRQLQAQAQQRMAAPGGGYPSNDREYTSQRMADVASGADRNWNDYAQAFGRQMQQKYGTGAENLNPASISAAGAPFEGGWARASLNPADQARFADTPGMWQDFQRFTNDFNQRFSQGTAQNPAQRGGQGQQPMPTPMGIPSMYGPPQGGGGGGMPGGAPQAPGPYGGRGKYGIKGAKADRAAMAQQWSPGNMGGGLVEMGGGGGMPGGGVFGFGGASPWGGGYQGPAGYGNRMPAWAGPGNFQNLMPPGPGFGGYGSPFGQMPYGYPAMPW